MLLYIAIFVLSCLGIIVSSRWVIDSLGRVTRSLGWKEFVVAFFTASIGAVLPEFFIGIRSAIAGVPELAFGNIVGQNLILFTFSVAICTFVLGGIVVESRTVRAGAGFALISVILPFILIHDGVISRIDGLILIAAFVLYVRWLFKDSDRFVKNYDDSKEISRSTLSFIKDILVIIGGFAIVVFAAEGIINSAQVFAESIGVSIGVIGLFFVGAGVALPETFLSIRLAMKGHSWMILGGLMGAIAMSSTLVLGVVALIEPIVIYDFEPYTTGRLFLILSGAVLFLFIRTSNKITKREAVILFLIYLSFLISQFIL